MPGQRRHADLKGEGVEVAATGQRSRHGPFGLLRTVLTACDEDFADESGDHAGGELDETVGGGRPAVDTLVTHGPPPAVLCQCRGVQAGEAPGHPGQDQWPHGHPGVHDTAGQMGNPEVHEAVADVGRGKEHSRHHHQI